MQKTAQRRSILNKLREMTNVSGIAAEKFFNPQFQEVMDNLRQVDDNIRSLVSGQAIDTGDPGKDPSSLKKLIQSAKTNLNRREYMTAVAELGRFHKKLFDIISQIGNLHNKVNEVHHQFLFQDLDDERKQQLHDLKSRWASERQESLRKEASIMDFFHNIGTARGRALAFYEKRYPKQVGKLKKDTATLLSRSEALLGQLLSSLKEMASGRATRNVDSYMRAAEKVKKAYDNYDKTFKDYYNDNIKGFLEKIELHAPTQKVEEKGLGGQEVNPEANLPFPLVNEKEPITQEFPPQTQVVVPSGGSPAQPMAPTEYAPPSLPIQSPPFPPPPRMPTNTGPIVSQRETIPSPEPEGMEERPATILPPRPAHQKLLSSLESLSGESPAILASVIRRYAKSIESQDPKTAIQLLKLASSIRS